MLRCTQDLRQESPAVPTAPSAVTQNETHMPLNSEALCKQRPLLAHSSQWRNMQTPSRMSSPEWGGTSQQHPGDNVCWHHPLDGAAVPHNHRLGAGKTEVSPPHLILPSLSCFLPGGGGHRGHLFEPEPPPCALTSKSSYKDTRPSVGLGPTQSRMTSS